MAYHQRAMLGLLSGTVGLLRSCVDIQDVIEFSMVVHKCGCPNILIDILRGALLDSTSQSEGKNKGFLLQSWYPRRPSLRLKLLAIL